MTNQSEEKRKVSYPGDLKSCTSKYVCGSDGREEYSVRYFGCNLDVLEYLKRNYSVFEMSTVLQGFRCPRVFASKFHSSKLE